MRVASLCRWLLVAVVLAGALPVSLSGQRGGVAALGGPLTGPPTFDAPFSAVATTTVRLSLGGARRLDQRTTQRYFRDARGRVRVESFIERPSALTQAERYLRTIIAADPTSPTVQTVDPQSKTFQYFPRSFMAMNGGGNDVAFSIPVDGVRFTTVYRAADLDALSERFGERPEVLLNRHDEDLGERRLAGLRVTGRRVTGTIQSSRRQGDAVDERWESAELGLLVYARHVDARGVIDYRLSDVELADPPPSLFEVPEEYTWNRDWDSKRPILSLALPETYGAKRSAGRAQ